MLRVLVDQISCGRIQVFIIFSVSTTPAAGNMTTGRLILVPIGMMVVKDNVSAQKDAAG